MGNQMQVRRVRPLWRVLDLTAAEPTGAGAAATSPSFTAALPTIAATAIAIAVAAAVAVASAATPAGMRGLVRRAPSSLDH